MALVDRDTAIRMNIQGILKETMGEDFQSQLAKRVVLKKEDKLIERIRNLEKYLNIKILDGGSL